MERICHPPPPPPPLASEQLASLFPNVWPSYKYYTRRIVTETLACVQEDLQIKSVARRCNKKTQQLLPLQLITTLRNVQQ